MPVSVKICGIATEAALDAAIEAGAGYAGFVFYGRSPRNISAENAARLVRRAAGRIATVALTVNASEAELGSIASDVRPDYFQFHGEESVADLTAIRNRFGLRIVKAIALGSAADLDLAAAFEPAADIVLFDAKPPDTAHALPGGNGAAFDWRILAGARMRRNFMLSGGLTPDNVSTAIAISGATAVDVSSGVETAPGVKSQDLIRRFVASAHAAAPSHTSQTE